jgi:glycosyltransferase involved in cell wall biosynthesis
MAKKAKLFAWCDFLVPTGFGNVAGNLLNDMHKYFDVTVLGINYHGDKKYDTNKYFVYPVSRDDMLGMKRLPHLIRQEAPDIIFLFQDIFHISDIIDTIRKTVDPRTKIVTYFPVDGNPFSKAWGNVFKAADINITYTDWAVRTIKETFPESGDIYKLYHGVDTNIYKPLEMSEIKKHRASFGWTNKFTAINVNRFQPRKAIPFSIRAFSLFAKGYKKCKCGNIYPFHKKFCDLNMCGPEDVVEKEKRYRTDVHLYLHMMASEPSMGPGRVNILQNHVLNAGFTDEDLVNGMISINAAQIYSGAITNEMVNQMYNAANVNINSTLGEGCGLSLIESMATGTPSIAPKNSAIPEMLGDTGHIIPNVGLMNQAMDSGHMRPIVDIWKFTMALEKEYQKWKESGKEKIIDQKCIDRVNKEFLWKDKVDFLKGIFDKAIA